MIIQSYLLNRDNGVIVFWSDLRGDGIALAGIDLVSPFLLSDQKSDRERTRTLSVFLELGRVILWVNDCLNRSFLVSPGVKKNLTLEFKICY